MNTSQYNSAQYNGDGDQETLVAHPTVKYRLQLHSRTGALVHVLCDWWGGTWTEKVNAVGSLSFSMPQDSEAGSSVDTSRDIWLLDQYGTINQKFRILTTDTVRQGKTLTIDVVCEAQVGRLNDEIIESYEAVDADNKTILDIIDEWLALQANSQQINLGTIDVAYKNLQRNITIKGKSILDGFRELYNTVGEGYWYVTPLSRRLNWKKRLGSRKGQRITVNKNMVGVTRSEDRRRMFTRLYLFGDGGSPDDALNLVDAGEANNYIEKNTGTYGTISKVIVNKDIKDADTLLQTANDLLNLNAEPRVTYSIDMADIENGTDGVDYTFDQVELGNTYVINDSDLGISITTDAISITKNLDNPIDVSVEFSDQTIAGSLGGQQPGGTTETIADYIEEVEERVETLEVADSSGPLSDLTPAAVGGTASAGTSGESSRSDHVHGLDSTVIKTIVNQAIADGDIVASLDAKWVTYTGP